MKRRKKLIVIVASVLVLLVIALKIAENSIDKKIAQELSEKVKSACKSCEVQIEEVDFDFVPLQLALKGVKFQGGRRVATQVHAEIPRVVVDIKMPWSRSEVPTVKSIDFYEPKVTVYEGDEKLGKSEPTPPPQRAIVRSMKVHDGTFAYIREHGGKQAPIKVGNIQMQFGEFTAGVEGFAEMSATALLETTGKVKMKTKTLLFGDHIEMHLENLVEDLNLEELNGYFENFEGVRVTGFVNRSFTVTQVKGTNAHSTSEASYKGLDIKFKENHKRSAVAAYFANIGTDLTLDRQSTEESRRQRTKSASITRDPEETLISFIVRSNGEAGMKITTSK